MKRVHARGLFAYILGTSAAFVGMFLGYYLLPRSPDWPPPRLMPAFDNVVDSLTAWDGQWYLSIAERGYWYERGQPSAVAFFPAYPVLIRFLVTLTGLPSHWVGLLVANVSLVLGLTAFGTYLEHSGADRARAAPWAVLSLALFPTSFFMRMVYSESLFLLLCLTLFVGMQRRWPDWALAALAGAITGTRPVGVAAVLPVLLHVWRGSRTPWEAARRLAALAPLAVWGLVAFMAYQWAAFGEPLAFAKTQHFWRMRPPLLPGQMLLALASWEPVWSVYVPGAPGYYASIDPGVPLLLSYQSANAVLFVGAILLLAIGRARGWLTGPETLFGASHLALTYVLAGYRFCMLSQGRFVAVVFPIYIVLGHILMNFPKPIAFGTLVIASFYLMTFSAMLAAGYVTI